jgi:P4 family phage/plasmid primase-like protien
MSFLDNNSRIGKTLARTAANAILDQVPIGLMRWDQDPDSDYPLWYYEGGVWLPGAARLVRSVLASEHGNDYRREQAAHVLAVLQHLPKVVELDDERPHPGWINFRNCMLRVEDLKSFPHDPSFRSTVQLAVDWNPEAECPEYEKWLAEVMHGDAHEYHDDLFGYCLCGNYLHKAILLLGVTRNGKGTGLRLQEKVVGKQHISNITLRNFDTTEHRFATAKLHMRLINACGDISGRSVTDSSSFKSITGQDTVETERKGQDAVSFRAWATPIFSANAAPRTNDPDAAYLGRWEVLEYPESFVGREDPSKEVAMGKELEGIARRWAMGAQRVALREGFDRPPSAEAVLASFKQDVDPVQAFVRDVFNVAPDLWETRAGIKAAYQAWNEDENRRSGLNLGSLYRSILAAFPTTVSDGQMGRERMLKGLRVTDDWLEEHQEVRPVVNHRRENARRTAHKAVKETLEGF